MKGLLLAVSACLLLGACRSPLDACQNVDFLCTAPREEIHSVWGAAPLSQDSCAPVFKLEGLWPLSVFLFRAPLARPYRLEVEARVSPGAVLAVEVNGRELARGQRGEVRLSLPLAGLAGLNVVTARYALEPGRDAPASGEPMAAFTRFEVVCAP